VATQGPVTFGVSTLDLYEGVACADAKACLEEIFDGALTRGKYTVHSRAPAQVQDRSAVEWIATRPAENDLPEVESDVWIVHEGRRGYMISVSYQRGLRPLEASSFLSSFQIQP
jgi:hypothetical protein